MQTDPVGYEDQMNLYAYVGNDPLNYVDPTGKNRALPYIARFVKEPVRTSRGLSRAARAVMQSAGILEPVQNESSDETGSSDQAGSDVPTLPGAEVDDFVDKLNDQSEPDATTGKSKVRTLTEGTVAGAFDNFPGESGEASDGTPIKTAEDGSTAHTHSSSKDNGRSTLTINRPSSSKPHKYRDQ